jgi:uncharacterized protein YegL
MSSAGTFLRLGSLGCEMWYASRMTKPNYTHITLVVDRSGSMQSTLSDANGGIKAFLDGQFSMAGEATTVSIYQFDDRFDAVVEFSDTQPVYTIVPRGTTALLDAIGKAATLTGEALAKLPEWERPSSVKLVIITDGQENASREWKRADLGALLKKQQDDYKWDVVFLASDLATVADAKTYGISTNCTLVFTGANTSATYATLNNATLRSRSSGMSLSFSEDERDAAVRVAV